MQLLVAILARARSKCFQEMPDPELPLTFSQRFCRTFACSEAEFEREALGWFLHSPWGGLVGIVRFFRPRAFDVDREFLARIGKMRRLHEVLNELRDLRSDYQRALDFGFTRRILRRRLSGDRLRSAAQEFWQGDRRK